MTSQNLPIRLHSYWSFVLGSVVKRIEAISYTHPVFHFHIKLSISENRIEWKKPPGLAWYFRQIYPLNYKTVEFLLCCAMLYALFVQPTLFHIIVIYFENQLWIPFEHSVLFDRPFNQTHKKINILIKISIHRKVSTISELITWFAENYWYFKRRL